MRKEQKRNYLNAPLYLVWEINKKCNAQCIHCYTSSGPEAKENQILSVPEMLSVADQLIKMKVFRVGISGGEPLLHQGIYTVLEKLCQSDVFVSLSTNGSTIDQEAAKRLRKMEIDSVCLSLDSSYPEVHDEIRRLPGLYNKAIEAARMLVKEGVPVVAGMTLMRYNYKETRRYIELVRSLGIRSVNITSYVPTGRGTPEHALEEALYRDYLFEINEMAKRYAGDVDIMWHDCRFTLIDESFSHYDHKGCGAANTSARITAEGEVTPCSTLPVSGGNVRDHTFEEIWNNSDFFHRMRDRKSYAADSNCAGCLHLEDCGGCRSMSHAYFKDSEAGYPQCSFEETAESPLATATKRS